MRLWRQSRLSVFQSGISNRHFLFICCQSSMKNRYLSSGGDNVRSRSVHFVFVCLNVLPVGCTHHVKFLVFFPAINYVEGANNFSVRNINFRTFRFIILSWMHYWMCMPHPQRRFLVFFFIVDFTLYFIHYGTLINYLWHPITDGATLFLGFLRILTAWRWPRGGCNVYP